MKTNNWDLETCRKNNCSVCHSCELEKQGGKKKNTNFKFFMNTDTIKLQEENERFQKT